jgi:hypothetical protein
VVGATVLGAAAAATVTVVVVSAVDAPSREQPATTARITRMVDTARTTAVGL